MEKKGKFPCHSLVCLVFAGDHGRTQRRSWTSSFGCLASTHSMALWTRRKRRRQLTTTPCTMPGHPRARIRTKVLHRHTLEMPLHGRVGIDLHLGQKPKLGGGGLHWRFTHLYIIFCQYFVYPCFAFFIFFVVLVLFLHLKTQKDQKYFFCFSLFAFLVF
jgi:hypothetical protein